MAILQSFTARHPIPYTLLSDPDSRVIDAFGLRNPAYPEGDMAHGVPFPGFFLIDAEGRILEKSFQESYRERRTAGSLFAGEDPAAGEAATVGADHFSVKTWASDAVAFSGNVVTLVAEIEMEEGHHAYAPGDHSYRGLALTLDPNPLFSPRPTRLPEPTPFHFAPLDETVPVFEGRFRVLQDLTLSSAREINETAVQNPILEVTGRLDYQVCSDRICYPPASRPLSWTLRLVPTDRQRVPEEIRHR